MYKATHSRYREGPKDLILTVRNTNLCPTKTEQWKLCSSGPDSCRCGLVDRSRELQVRCVCSQAIRPSAFEAVVGCWCCRGDAEVDWLVGRETWPHPGLKFLVCYVHMSGTRSCLRERESDAHFACHELLHEHPWRRMPPRVAQLHAIEPCDLCARDSLSCLLTIAISRCWPRTLCAQGAMTYGSLSVSNIYLQMSEHAPPTRSRHLLPPLLPGAATRLESYTQLPRPTSGSLALASRLICCCCLSVKCPTIWCVAQLLPSCCRAAPLACE